MKKGKKDKLIVQKVRITNLDNELELKERLHALIDKKDVNKKSAVLKPALSKNKY